MEIKDINLEIDVTDNTYIFCFLDILGYKNFVNDSIEDWIKVNKFRKALNLCILELQKIYIQANESKKNEKNNIVEAINISLISDSILIRLLIPYNDENKVLCYKQIYTFLYFVSFLVAVFTEKVGLFLRGGVTIGQHYERNLDNNSQFMFSKAFIEAYKLEKKAKSIRILIEPEIVSFMDSFKKPVRYFYKDIDSLSCLDFYEVLDDHRIKDKYLTSYIKHVKKHVKENKADIDVISKFIPYIKYHNCKIKDFNLPQYKIDMNLLD